MYIYYKFTYSNISNELLSIFSFSFKLVKYLNKLSEIKIFLSHFGFYLAGMIVSNKHILYYFSRVEKIYI